MEFTITLPERPFRAIKNGTKKVEGRVPKEADSKYHKMAEGDNLLFTNENTQEKMKVAITFVHHYPDTRSMLVAEGVKNVLSSGGTIEDGTKGYNSFEGYEENLPKYGIYAIGVKRI